MRKPLRYLLTLNSPTQINLNYYLNQRGWQLARFAWQAHFNDKHFQFNKQVTQTLEYKHLLAQLVQRHCPQIMTTTYCLTEQNWPTVLAKLQHDYYQFADAHANLHWILKPALLNNGQHIHIFARFSDIKRHYETPQRLGGAHVLQHYISRPHLLRDNRKYSMRLFLVLTNYAGAFLYRQGYFNIAKHPYAPNQFNDLRPHLTNEHLLKDEQNIIQIPSDHFTHFADLYQQIFQHSKLLITALQQQFTAVFFGKKSPRLALFGLDFMVDCTGKVFLLEANHGPCFPTDLNHPLQQPLYQSFWQHFIERFIEPIATNTLTDSMIKSKYFDALE